jgi:hypothetical protein
MRTFAIAALIATVQAEMGYTCVQPTTNWADKTGDNADVGAADSITKCGAACTAVAELAANNVNDYCCFAIDTAADDTASPAVTASSVCKIWMMVTTDATDVDIKGEKATADGLSYNAWSWDAGVA